MTKSIHDLIVVGGGINGAGIAADAAGRGLSVVLAEKGDLASGTSSASSKLIHGGLRYLEHYELRLVRHALIEREVLLAKAPHIVHPLRFVLPHEGGQRPRWMIRAGLMLYDHLARRRLIPGSRAIDLSGERSRAALRADLRHGFAYWDCSVDDARLTVVNARDAASRGAEIMTRTEATRVRADGGHWVVGLAGEGGVREVAGRVLVNAAGPWAGRFNEAIRSGAAGVAAAPVRLVKGSHIAVARVDGLDDAVLLQARDGRVVFLLPFEERFTLIGTTDVVFEGDPGGAAISTEERDYLLEIANGYLRRALGVADIVWSFAGVRPLYDDHSANPSAVTRDYRLELESSPAHPPLLTVLGGKITTYRRLAEDAMGLLAPHLPHMGPAWTAASPLPGGDLGGASFEAFVAELQRRRPGFDPPFIAGLARRHGGLTEDVLGDARSEAEMGQAIGGGLTEAEVRYLARHEWARNAEDVLWRRTKCGLHMSEGGRKLAAERIAAIL